MEFERVLKEIGGFGLFSKTVMTAAGVLVTWHAVVSFLGHVLILMAPPSQWCFAEGLVTYAEGVDMSTLPRGRCQFIDNASDAAGGGYANITWRHDSGAPCPTGWRYDTDEFFTSVTMENDWVCGDNWKMYVCHMACWAGSMTGFLISGLLADRIGRKKTILILLFLGGSGNALSPVFSSFEGFAALRFVTGMGASTVSSAVFVTAIEFTVSHRRSLITLIFAVSWSCLAAALPWIGYLVQSWRILLVTGAVVDVLLAGLVWFLVPESPRWLLSVGRREEAVASLSRIARFNGKNVSEETLNKLLMLETDTDGADAQVPPPEKPPGFLRTTLLLVKSPRIRRLTLLIYFTWFTIGLCYNAITLQLGRLGLDIYMTYSVAIGFEMPVNVLCVPLMEYVGRRWTGTTFLFIAAAASLFMGLLRPNSETWILVLAVVSLMAVAGAYNVTSQQTPELFPTVIRGRAVLLQKLLGEAGSLLGTQVASLVERDTYTPMLVMGALSVAATVASFFLPETLEQALPQTIEDGENFGKDQGLCFCPMSAARRARRERKQEKRITSTTEKAHKDDGIATPSPHDYVL